MIIDNPTISGSALLSGSLTITGPLNVSGSISGLASNAVSASYALISTSASYALVATSASQANNADTATSASYALVATSASYSNNSTSASYALNATTSSFALNATTSSFALASTSASYALASTSASYALNATTSSFALASTSASYSNNSDLLDGRDSLTFANTGSNAFVGTQNINGSVAITGSLTITGAITAQTLNVQQVTSSIVYSSGSNIFGNSVSNTQSMTGSVGISGSLAVTGAAAITGALTLNSTITNGTYTYTLPSATGTLALTSALSSYLPLSAGISYPLTGDLYIRKSDGFQNIIIQPTTTTSAAGTRFLNAGNDMYFFIDNSAGDYGPTGGNGPSFAYNANIRVVGNRALQIATNDTVRLTIASTGAATFSSSGLFGGELSVGGSLSADRMFQVSGTAFTSGATQFGIVNNPTMTTPTTIYGYYGGITVTSATTAYGLYLTSASGTITTKYGIYQEGSADKNYFAGNVGIGTTSALQTLTLAGTQMMYNTGGDGVANVVLGSITSQVRNYGTGIATSSFASIQFATDPTTWYRGDIRFLTNGSDGTSTSGTERMRITSAGTLMVGASVNNTTADISTIAQLISSRTTTSYPLTLSTAGTGVTNDQIRMSFNYGTVFSATAYFGSYLEDGATAATGLVFGTYSAGSRESMRITAGGDVGIGTASPTGMLQVGSVDADSDGQIVIGKRSGASNRKFRLGLDASYNFSIGDFGNNISNTYSPYLTIGFSSGDVTVKGTLANFTIGGSGAEVFFGRNATNYITANGGAGSTIRIISNTNGVELSNGATSWVAVSDENVKVMTEWKTFINPLEKIISLRAGTSRYKTDSEDISRSFLIAQDVQKVLPEAVSVDEDGILGLRYTEVIPLMIAAIQEQQAQIEAQQAQITELQNK